MRKEREELRRGIRAFIADASAELAEFTGTADLTVSADTAPSRDASAGAPAPASPPRGRSPDKAQDRPILRLVREASGQEAERPRLEEMTLNLPRKGVCAAYFVNKRCWELPHAYCNQALHICRLRECPVYDLHRQEMDARFAGKFKHLW